MPRRISPLATPLTRDWRSLAETTIAAKAEAPHGERAARIVEAAAQARTTPVLVRRAITTRVALMRLEAKGVVVPDVVFALPVGVAEAVARWAGRDPQTAWQHAEAYAADTITFQAVIDAERASRQAATGLRRTRLRSDADPAAWRARQLAAFATAEGRRVVAPAADDLPVDGWLRDDRLGIAAVLIVGPHIDLETYLAHRAACCVTAVGIARLAGRAILVVPSEDVALHYSSWLVGRSVSPNDVSVEIYRPPRRAPRRSKPVAEIPQ